MGITVGSQRKGSLNPPLEAVVIKIDRASVLGNPFDMGYDESRRDSVCEAHEDWLNRLLQQPDLDAVALAESMAKECGLKLASSWRRSSTKAVIEELYRIQQLSQTREVWIMCWCSPLRCHGLAYVQVIQSGAVEAAYANLNTPVEVTTAQGVAIPDWWEAVTPEAIAAKQFQYRDGWIKNWFSNMEPFERPVAVGGLVYHAPEDLYQAMKTADVRQRKAITEIQRFAGL